MHCRNLCNQETCPRCQTPMIVGADVGSTIRCTTCLHKFRPNHPHIQILNDNPPLMSDGRFLTDHHPTRESMDMLCRASGFRNSNKFRNHVQDNAQNIIDSERDELTRENRCKRRGCTAGWFDL